MARSIALDVQADGGVLIETVSRDDFSATDHTMALHLYQGPRTADATPEHPSITPPPTQTLDEEFLQKLQILYISGVEAKDGSTSGELDEPDFDLVASSLPESSTLAASWYALLKTMFTKCTIFCYQIDRYDAARVPGSCRYRYSRGCPDHLFTLSMSDEALFPPRYSNESISRQRAPFPHN